AMLQIRALAALAACCAAGVALAQQAPAEEPGWAKGRPKTDTAMKMAPVPAFPIPTPAARLQGRDLGLGRARCARDPRGAERNDRRQHAFRRQQGLRVPAGQARAE